MTGEPKKKSTRNWQLKYKIERTLSTFGLVACSPLFLIISFAVKITSKGPILYKAERLGLDGNIFLMKKFRSMKVGVNPITAEDGKVITVKNDPRLTLIGKILRLGFDELPQLLNVLNGEMCLIGPRPDIPEELNRYTERERIRLMMRPGITGLTQVVGGREMNNALNYELDVRYYEHSDFLTDLGIVALTLPYSFGAKKIGRRVFSKYLKGL